MRIALDLENVLADVYSATLDHSDQLDDSHFQQWDFESDRTFSHFMDVTHDVWARHTEDILPTEHDVGGTVRSLRQHHTVDLVTNRDGVDDRIQQWLAWHDVDVDGFRSNPQGTPKQAMDYDVYVDDNPNLAGEVDLLYLYDQPWNQHVDGHGQYVYHEYGEASEYDWYPIATIGTAPIVVRITELEQVRFGLNLDRGALE